MLTRFENESHRSWFDFTWINNLFIQPITAVAATQGIASHYGIILNCKPTSERSGYCPTGRDNSYHCQIVERNSTYIGLTMGYLTLLANVLPLFSEELRQSTVVNKIVTIVNFIIESFKTHDFFLLMLSIILSNTISAEISTGNFFLWIVAPAIFAVIALNDNIRYRIYPLLGWYDVPSEERNNVAKTIDLMMGFLKGSMFGILTIKMIETVADIILDQTGSPSSWQCSLNGIIVCYVIGVGLVGSIHGIFSWKNNLAAIQDESASRRTKLVTNVESVIATIIFLSYLVPAILDNKKIDIEVMVGIIAFMFILSSLFYISHIKSVPQIPEQINTSSNFPDNAGNSPLLKNSEERQNEQDTTSTGNTQTNNQTNNQIIVQKTNSNNNQEVTQQTDSNTVIPVKSHLMKLTLFNKKKKISDNENEILYKRKI